MRKQGMLAGQSMEMPNELNCSSIRVNQEEEDPQLYTARNTLNAPYSKNKFFKQFEQNSINGLEGSLSMSANKEKILELLRSKSLQELKHSAQKDGSIAKQPSSSNPQGISLYNTSSFDDMTMKMTIKNNISHASAVSNLDKRQLKRPEEMKKFKATYGDSDMKIVLNNQKVLRQHQSMQEPKNLLVLIQQGQSAQDLEARQQKVDAFVKRQTLLASLQCSNVQSEPSKNFQQLEELSYEGSSYQEPYFNKQQSSELNIIKNQDSPIKASLRSRKPDIQVQINNKKTSSGIKIDSGSPKKLTLRDYINLNHLKNQVKQQQQVGTPFSHGQPSPRLMQKPLSPRSALQRSRRKNQASNRQVFDSIKQQICKDISLVKKNMELLLGYLESQGNSDPTQEQLLQVYSIRQVIKDTILVGNDQVVKNLKPNPEARADDQNERLFGNLRKC